MRSLLTRQKVTNTRKTVQFWTAQWRAEQKCWGELREIGARLEASPRRSFVRLVQQTGMRAQSARIATVLLHLCPYKTTWFTDKTTQFVKKDRTLYTSKFTGRVIVNYTYTYTHTHDKSRDMLITLVVCNLKLVRMNRKLCCIIEQRCLRETWSVSSALVSQGSQQTVQTTASADAIIAAVKREPRRSSAISHENRVFPSRGSSKDFLMISWIYTTAHRRRFSNDRLSTYYTWRIRGVHGLQIWYFAPLGRDVCLENWMSRNMYKIVQLLL